MALKSIIRLMPKAVLVISLVGTFQTCILVAYINMTLDLDFEKLLLFFKYGLPVIAVLLACFAVSIPLSGRWLMKFLGRYDEGDSFSDEELERVQHQLINFPYIVALISLLFWVIPTPIAIFFVRRPLGFDSTDIIFGMLGGLIGGTLNIPLSVYATNLITRPVIDLTCELSPNISRGGKIGIEMPLSWKISIAFVTMILGYVVYMALVGYARMVRFPTEGISSSLASNFVLLSTAMLLLTAMLAVLAARDITTMLTRLKDTTAHMAEGKFEERANVITNDEVGELAATVNIMAERLEQNRLIMEKIQEGLDNSAGKLLETTKKILGIAQEQSSGATEQAVMMREVESTHDMILDTARQVATAADKSDDSVSKVLSATKDGIRRSAQTVQGIEALQGQVSEIAKAIYDVESCVQRVGDALKAINEIAERTNLLSLNAALEAAGAGGEGQRFSVVAEQIRRLAEKSRSSAKQIETIMEEINTATARASQLTAKGEKSSIRGVGLVRDIRTSFDIINEMAVSSSELARKIDLSSRQQQTSLEQALLTLKDVVTGTEETLEGARRTESELGGIEELAAHIRSMTQDQERVAYASDKDETD